MKTKEHRTLGTVHVAAHAAATLTGFASFGNTALVSKLQVVLKCGWPEM